MVQGGGAIRSVAAAAVGTRFLPVPVECDQATITLEL